MAKAFYEYQLWKSNDNKQCGPNIQLKKTDPAERSKAAAHVKLEKVECTPGVNAGNQVAALQMTSQVQESTLPLRIYPKTVASQQDKRHTNQHTVLGVLRADTTQQGLITPGQVQLKSGQVQMNPGQVLLNPGRVKLNSGQVHLNSGQVQLNSGQVQLISGQVPLSSGQVQLNSGQVQLNSGQVQLISGQVPLSSGQVQLNSGQVQLNSRQVQLNSGLVQLNSRPVKSRLNCRQVQLNSGQVQLNSGQVQLNSGQVQLISGQVPLSSGQVQLNSGQVQLNSRPVKSRLNCRQVQLNFGQVQLNPGQVQLNPGQVHLNTEQVLLNPRQVLFNSRQVKLNSGQVQLNSGQIQLNPGQVQLNSRQVQLNPGQVQLNSGQVQLNSGPTGMVIVSPQVLSGPVSRIATSGTPTFTNASILYAKLAVQNSTATGHPSTPTVVSEQGNVHTKISGSNVFNNAPASKLSNVPALAPVTRNAVPLNASKLLQTISTGKHVAESNMSSSPGISAHISTQQHQHISAPVLSNIVLKPSNNVIPIQSRPASQVQLVSTGMSRVAICKMINQTRAPVLSNTVLKPNNNAIPIQPRPASQVQQVSTGTSHLTIPKRIHRRTGIRASQPTGVTHLQYILPSNPAQMTGKNKTQIRPTNQVQLGRIQLTMTQPNTQFPFKTTPNNSQLTIVPGNQSSQLPSKSTLPANPNLSATPIFALNGSTVQTVYPVISSHQPGQVTPQIVRLTTNPRQTHAQSPQRLTVQPVSASIMGAMGTQPMTIMTQPFSPVVTMAGGLPAVTRPSSQVCLPRGTMLQDGQHQQKLVLPAGQRVTYVQQHPGYPASPVSSAAGGMRTICPEVKKMPIQSTYVVPISVATSPNGSAALERHSNRLGLSTTRHIKPFACRYCRQTWECFDRFKQHVMRHQTKLVNFHHPKSRGLYFYKTSVISRSHSYVKGKMYGCSIDRSNFRQSFNLRTHTGEKPFKCTQCDKFFAHASNLRTHIKKHTGDKPHKCIYCLKSFVFNSYLTDHIRIHTGDKPFKCTHCDKHFAHASNLSTHIRKRNGDKRFKCIYCSKCFVYKSYLTCHLRKHTGDKPFRCAQCDTGFTSSRGLTNHIRTHTKQTGNKPFRCTKCNKTFTSRSSLPYHTRKHAGEKPFKCTYCFKSFMYNSYLTRHISSHAQGHAFSPCQHISSSVNPTPIKVYIF